MEIILSFVISLRSHRIERKWCFSTGNKRNFIIWSPKKKTSCTSTYACIRSHINNENNKNFSCEHGNFPVVLPVGLSFSFKICYEPTQYQLYNNVHIHSKKCNVVQILFLPLKINRWWLWLWPKRLYGTVRMKAMVFLRAK